MISSDYLRVFATIVEKGSFSAASRVLNRSQTAISYSIRSLEDQLGVSLFDRSGRRPVLTPAGTALIAEAQTIVHGIDNLRARAGAIARGAETELVVAVDAYLPPATLGPPLYDLARRFPETLVTLRTTGVGNALKAVADGRASLGIVSMATSQSPGFQQLPLDPPVRLRPVAAPDHPLAKLDHKVTVQHLDGHIQLLTLLNLPYEPGVFSRRVWHCSDLQSQRELLLAGVGWSVMPEHLIAEDIAAGRLKPLSVISWSTSSWSDLVMCVIYRSDVPLGPVGRWLAARLAGEGDGGPV